MSDKTKDTEPPIPLTAMTLRDHFAACAATGILAGSTTPISHAKGDGIALVAYEIADAMLAERAKGGGK